MKPLIFFVGVLLTVWLAAVAISNVAYSKQGDERVFAGWILHMFISGQLKEYTPRGGMTACLKIKRKIMRSQGRDHGVRWECKKGKLRLSHYDGGIDGMRWLPVEHLGEE